jgi:nicotinamide phosphoribosyltransferase
MKTNPFLLTDFYKVSHFEQYPPGTEFVYSTWIPRSTYIPDITEVVAFGFQAFIQKYLLDYFDTNFFERPRDEVLEEYARIIRNTLGVKPRLDHIDYLWNLGYLPLCIKAVPEGTRIPLRVPMLTIENTDPKCFWLTNAIESLFSCENWLPATSATIAASYREILDGWAAATGADPAGVQFQAHDFSLRGMTSAESAASSGAGHLLSFTGTDSIPSICHLEKYYGADVTEELVGTSIPATEHSVMCAYGQDELGSYRRLLTDVYPNGLVSVVSDTWDLWNVLTVVLPELKDEIMARDGKLVIRPDSGDPADIICGDRLPVIWPITPAHKGVIELLWDTFGGTVNAKGYKELDSHIGAIYGDSITRERANDICQRLAAKGFASSNIVFGVGSYTYQFQTRDTFGFALKSTAVTINGEERAIFKDPVTDTGGVKKSLTGRVWVYEDRPGGSIVVADGLDSHIAARFPPNLLQCVFRDGSACNVQTLAEIRDRLRGSA